MRVKYKYSLPVFDCAAGMLNDVRMNNIARIRKARGLRQGDLAEMVGISQPHISRIEGGDEGPPLSLFRTIADALNVPLAALFSDSRSHIEQAVLDAFRSLPENRQAGWVEMARLVKAEAQAANQASDPDRHAKEK